MVYFATFFSIFFFFFWCFWWRGYVPVKNTFVLWCFARVWSEVCGWKMCAQKIRLILFFLRARIWGFTGNLMRRKSDFVAKGVWNSSRVMRLLSWGCWGFRYRHEWRWRSNLCVSLVSLKKMCSSSFNVQHIDFEFDSHKDLRN